MAIYKKRWTSEGKVYFERYKTPKKKPRKCLVCSTILRTGKKYCYKHRNFNKKKVEKIKNIKPLTNYFK